MVNNVVDLFIENKVIGLENREKEIYEFNNAYLDGRLKEINYRGKVIGYIKWLEIWHKDEQWVFIDRLLIFKDYRANFYKLKHIIPKSHVVYWFNQKKNKYIYMRLKGEKNGRK